MSPSSYGITKEDIGKRRMTRRRSEKQMMRRVSSDESSFHMNRVKSDRLKQGVRSKRRYDEFGRKESEQKVPTIVEVKESATNNEDSKQTIERDESNETVQVEISVEDDVLEIVFSREEVEGEQLEHHATVHEAEEKNAISNEAENTNSIVLCPSNLQVCVGIAD